MLDKGKIKWLESIGAKKVEGGDPFLIDWAEHMGKSIPPQYQYYYIIMASGNPMFYTAEYLEMTPLEELMEKKKALT